MKVKPWQLIYRKYEVYSFFKNTYGNMMKWDPDIGLMRTEDEVEWTEEKFLEFKLRFL